MDWKHQIYKFVNLTRYLAATLCCYKHNTQGVPDKLVEYCSFLAHLNESSGRLSAIVVSLASASTFEMDCLVRLFKDPYILNSWMESFDTCTVAK